MVRWQTLVLLSLLVGFLPAGILGEEWLDGGPDYGEVRSWFSDPIFFSSIGSPRPGSFHDQYYPYFGAGFFGDSVQPVRLGMRTAKPLNRSLLGFYPSRPTGSEFRNKSLANLQWSEFNKNWTATLSYAQNNSSFRVYSGGIWRTF